MTGGAIAGTKTYLKTTTYLDENSMKFMSGLADMNHARDAHGMISWKNRYIIVVGSWHVETSTRTCEIFDIKHNKWHELPSLNEGTCAPGLIIVKDRYLYKLGGTTDIGKVEMLDLHKINIRAKRRNKKYFDRYLGFNSDSSEDDDTLLLKRQCPELYKHNQDVEMENLENEMDDENMWITITTCNKMGRKATINRCLLYPLSPIQGDCDQFLVLGCHFGRSEAPFCYDTNKNKYVKFQKQELFIDMYRSNDVVQFDKNFIYVRPFVKVGEPSDSVKVFKYYMEKTKMDLSKIAKYEENGPDKRHMLEVQEKAQNQKVIPTRR